MALLGADLNESRARVSWVARRNGAIFSSDDNVDHPILIGEGDVGRFEVTSFRKKIS